MVNSTDPRDIDPSRPIESIAVPSTDPDEKTKKPTGTGEGDGKEGGLDRESKEDKEKKKEEEMNEEDLQLRNELEMLVERLKENSIPLYLPSLQTLRTLIKTSTSSMTSVPKPLKFLRPFYGELIGLWEGWEKGATGGAGGLLSSVTAGLLGGKEGELVEERSLLASIISVLAMTYSDTGNRDTLHYRLVSNSTESPGDWGHEYVRHLASEIGEEYAKLIEGESGIEVETEDEKENAAAAQKEKEKEANGIASEDAMAIDPKEANEDRHRPAQTTAEAGFSAMTSTSTTVIPDHILHPNRPLKEKSQLLALALECVPFFLTHNAEADAVDLLMELESIELLSEKGFLEGKEGEASYARVCQYMISCVPLLVPPDDKAFLRTAAAIYASHGRYPEALALAVRVRDRRLVRKYFEGPANVVMKKQLAFFLARAQIPISWVHCADPDSYVEPEEEGEEDHPMDGANGNVPPPTLDEELLECMGNIKLSEHFRRFAKELDVMEPRSLEDIYKSHLDTGGRTVAPTIDSARANLAGTFVNAFVNAGYGNDKLVVDVEDGQSFIYKNKGDGMMSATASLGLSMLWDTDVGVSQVDKYSYSAEEHIKAGALLAIGILHNGIRAELDVAYALLEEHVDNKSVPLKVAAINGIALACVGTCRQDIADKLLPYVADDATSMEVSSMAALALGYVFVGSGNGDIAISIVQTLMERSDAQLSEKWARFMALALGLVFLGKQEASEATLELLKTIEHPMAKQAEIIVDICSYAGTGNVLKIQTLLHHCSDHEEVAEDPAEDAPAADAAASGDASGSGTAAADAAPAVSPEDAEKEKKEKKEKAKEAMKYQAYCVIGIALVAMGEEVGAQMSLRQFGHLMVYGDPIVRKSVPLALGLISASNPQLVILDSLSRYSHDTDLEVAANAILAMGLVGAGTNNARLAQMLRQLATYYAKEANCLFMVRIAQGLVHMGKGTIGINPFFHDRTILSPSALSGLLALLVSFVDAQSFVLDKSHWMLYWLVTAMYPQFLITLDEELNEKAVTVRVGQAVNTVGLAGQRMGISGFQTHSTPVRIAVGERAEFGTNEYFPYASQLENIVIIKRNSGYDAEDMQT